MSLKGLITPMKTKTVAVLFGGQSSEHDISDMSACFIINNIDNEKYDVLKIGITRDGKWWLYTGTTDSICSHFWQDDTSNLLPCVISPCSAHHGIIIFDKKNEKYAIKHIDVVFPALHGKNGEDGTIQGLLELSGIPYVGCDTYSSAVCMNKIAAKKLGAVAGIKTAASVDFERVSSFDMNRAVCIAEEALEYPMFVKPANAGSSVGITKAYDRAQLISGIETAFAHDRFVLVEETLVGREVEVAVFGGDGETIVSICGEIAPNSEFYDYDTKYLTDTAEYFIPARISGQASERVRDAAEKIYTRLGCFGLSRVDFFVTADEEVYFNEINTLPGFTSISMYPQLMERVGLDGGALVEALIERAYTR